MNRDDLNDLLMGVAVVALGYAVYSHFKPAAKAKAAQVAAAPDTPKAALLPYSSLSLDQLLYGAANDVGAFQGHNYLALLESPSLDWWKK